MPQLDLSIDHLLLTLLIMVVPVFSGVVAGHDCCYNAGGAVKVGRADG